MAGDRSGPVEPHSSLAYDPEQPIAETNDGDISTPLSRDPNWYLEQVGFVPELEHEIESRFALSNGHLGMRASLPSPTSASRPRFFVSGLFGLAPQEPRTPSLVPLPNWNWIRVAIDGSSI